MTTKMIAAVVATIVLCSNIITVALAANANVNVNVNEEALIKVQQQQQQQQRQQQQQQQPEAYQQRMVDWVRSDPKGFFHQSIQFQRLGSDGRSGPYAMHVTQDIPKGTTLINLPRKYVIENSSNKDNDDNNQDDNNNVVVDYHYDDGVFCANVQLMLTEYEKQEKSFFAPYLSYLFDETVGGTTRGLLPSSWSRNGKDILNLILDVDDDGSGDSTLEPENYEFISVFHDCIHGFDFGASTINATLLRQRAEDANLFIASRAWFEKLIPVIDMLNHSNGPSTNVGVSPIHDNDKKDIAAYALRDIAAGEQMQYSYSECMDATCSFGALKYSFTTQDIFEDYGFVELYPRRWLLGGELEEDKYEYEDEDEDEDEDDDEDEDEDKYEEQNQDLVVEVDVEVTMTASSTKQWNGEVREGVEQLGQRERELQHVLHNTQHEMEMIKEIYEGYDEDKDDKDEDYEYEEQDLVVEVEAEAEFTTTASITKQQNGEVYEGVEQLGQREQQDQDQDQNQHLVAEVTTITTTDNNGTAKQQKVLKWIFENPDEKTVMWITEQLSRLKSIESEVREEVEQLGQREREQHRVIHNTEHEMDIIIELYEGYVEILEMALEHKDDPVSVTREDFQNELKEMRSEQKSIEDIRNELEL